jgi:CPA2 family monovalent cation:H+ antiporter-2
MFRAVPRVEALLKRNRALWAFLNRHGPPPNPQAEGMKDHVVVVGYGRVGHHIVEVLETLGITRLVVDVEAARIQELDKEGIPTLFADAANSEALKHAGLYQARALVVTVPDEATAEVVVAKAREACPTVPIIARAGTEEGVGRLYALGANDVIHPELEGGLEIVRFTLLRLNLPPNEIQKYTDTVRHDHYDYQVSTSEEYRSLEQLTLALRGLEIQWHIVQPSSPLLGKTVASVGLRDATGASVIAVLRDNQIAANPKSAFEFQAGDVVGIVGEADQIRQAEDFLRTHIESNETAPAL